MSDRLPHPGSFFHPLLECWRPARASERHLAGCCRAVSRGEDAGGGARQDKPLIHDEVRVHDHSGLVVMLTKNTVETGAVRHELRGTRDDLIKLASATVSITQMKSLWPCHPCDRQSTKNIDPKVSVRHVLTSSFHTQKKEANSSCTKLITPRERVGA